MSETPEVRSPERPQQRSIRRAVTTGRHRLSPPETYPSLHSHLLRALPRIAGAVLVIAVAGGLRYEYDAHQPIIEIPDTNPYVQIDPPNPSHTEIIGHAPEQIQQSIGSSVDSPSSHSSSHNQE